MSKKLPCSHKTYAIAFGFAEGPWQAKQFREIAAQYGLKEVSTSKADVIFAHSGGCFLVPSDTKALVLHINPTIWPERSTISSLARRFPPKKLSISSTVYRVIYAGNFSHAREMVKARSHDLPGKNSIIIRNTEDTYLSPQVFAGLQQPKKEFAGGHDDIWQNPEKYIQLVI